MKVTKENYKEVLADIEAEFNLYEVTSVSARNGYPEGIIPLCVGLESEEQAEEILAKYPQVEFFELEWREGWNTRYRLNRLAYPRCYEADEELQYDNDICGLWRKGDSVEEFEVFFLGEGLQYKAEELIKDLQDCGLQIDKPKKDYDECGIEEYQDLCDRADELIYNAQMQDEPIYVEDYIYKELEEMKESIDEVVEMRKEFLALEEGEVLRIDNYHRTRIVQEKSMSWYDRDVTYRCIAVGFDPYFLQREEEEDEE